MRGSKLKLRPNHVSKAVEKLPEFVVGILKQYGKDVIVAGGFLRSIAQNEEIHDVDLFVTGKELAEKIGEELKVTNHKLRTTPKSYYVKTDPIVQVIHKFVYPTVEELIESFDFTIACAAIWWDKDKNTWDSYCLGTEFYNETYYWDLEGKALVFRYPDREDDAMSGVLRMLKFAKMGYHIPKETVAGVVGRAFSKLPLTGIEEDKKPAFDGDLMFILHQPVPLTLEKKYANLIAESITDMTGVS